MSRSSGELTVPRAGSGESDPATLWEFDQAPEPRRGKRKSAKGAPRRKLRWYQVLISFLGEILITVGAFVLLFVVWQLWWTDVVADRHANETVIALEKQWSSSNKKTDPKIGGDVFAIIRIPRFGADYARPVYQGETLDILKLGVGHYRNTAMPGEVGNFSMAGHRTTYGKPFSEIDTLRAGDPIIIETAKKYYVYKFTSSQIVRPWEGEVISPVPNKPGEEPKKKMLTMTSCHPKFSAQFRYIAHGELDKTYKRADGLPKVLSEATTP